MGVWDGMACHGMAWVDKWVYGMGFFPPFDVFVYVCPLQSDQMQAMYLPVYIIHFMDRTDGKNYFGKIELGHFLRQVVFIFTQKG